MKLSDIRTHTYEVDMPRKMGDANSPRGRKRSSNVILELITDEGLTGISTTGFSLCNGPVVLTAPSNFATYNWSNGASTSPVLTVMDPLLLLENQILS